MSAPDARTVASELARAGYHGLFLAGDSSAAPAVYAGGANRAALEEIVGDATFGDLERVLAAEVLYRLGGAPEAGSDVLAGIYARALELTGAGDGPVLFSGNLWGTLWVAPGADGPLGTHLVEQGDAAVPPLVALLDDDARIRYEGSREVMVGTRQKYRVKDAAAYFLGRITGRDVPFHAAHAERDAEIGRLKAAVAPQ